MQEVKFFIKEPAIGNYLRFNYGIRAPRVFLVDEKGKALGEVSLNEALKVASVRNYDLVEINPQANPPICKLLDYDKYRYQQDKKTSKKKLPSQEVKEIRLSLKIEEHDWQVKLRKAKKFLEKGHKVKVVLRAFGRELLFRDRILNQIERFKEGLGAKTEQGPVKLGNRFITLLSK